MRGPQLVDADPYVVSLPDVEGVVQVRQYVIISPLHLKCTSLNFFSNILVTVTFCHNIRSKMKSFNSLHIPSICAAVAPNTKCHFPKVSVFLCSDFFKLHPPKPMVYVVLEIRECVECLSMTNGGLLRFSKVDCACFSSTNLHWFYFSCVFMVFFVF